MDEVTQNIRAALISTKEACDIRKLRTDYCMIVGEDIPYRKFGFSSVEDLLQTIPSVRLSYLPNGVAIVSAVTTQEVAHIVNLVAGQKTAKKKLSYASSRVKSFHPKFGFSKSKPSYPEYRKQLPTSKKPYYVPPYRRHSEYSYTPPRYSKSSGSSRRRESVFSRLGAKVFSPDEYDDDDEYDDVEPVRTVKSTVFSVADRLNVNRREMTVTKTNNANNNLIIEVKNSIIKREVITGPTNRFGEILTKVSEIKTNEESGPKMEKISTGPTSRMSDIFLKMSKMKNNSQSSPKIEAEEKVESNRTTTFQKLSDTSLPSPEEPNRMSAILQKMAELKVKETSLPSPEMEEKIKENIRMEQILSRVSKIKKNVFNNYPPPGFSSPRIDRPRMRIHHNASQTENNPVSFKLRSPLASPKQEESTASATQIRPSNLFTLQSNRKISTENISDSAVSPDEHITKPVSKTNLFFDTAKQKENVNPDKLQKESLEFVDCIPVNKEVSDLLLKSAVVEIISVEDSPIRIWFKSQEIASMDNFQTFTNRMDAAYSSELYLAETISEGKFYVAQEKGDFHRVRVLKVISELEEVECLLVDCGLMKIFKTGSLRKLMKQFSVLPCQTMSCSLIGLKHLNNFKSAFTRVRNLKSYKFLAKMYSANDWALEFFQMNHEINISVNEIIFQQIVEDSHVTLNELKSTKGFITHIDKTGEIYVQLISEAQQHFVKFTQENIFDSITTVKNAIKDTVYLLRNFKSQMYKRCKILDFSPGKDYAQIYFMDSGKTGIFKLANITLYETSSRFIKWFPALAVRTKLDFESSETPKELTRFVELFSGEKNVFGIRIIHFEDLEGQTIPVCDFFLPTENERGLVSLKKLILQKIEQEENNIRIPSPVIPMVKSFLNVKILHVVNPYLFYAQPFDTANEFQKLMKDIQESYHTSPNPPKIVTPGFYYAFKHVDGFWYRVIVKKLVSAHKAAIFFCDFGFQFEVGLHELYILKPQFYDVPSQAIKLKLSGIKPMFGVWVSECCDLFAELVEHKNFVCYVIKMDEFDLITVNMFDTSSDTDINISTELIVKNIATYND